MPLLKSTIVPIAAAGGAIGGGGPLTASSQVPVSGGPPSSTELARSLYESHPSSGGGGAIPPPGHLLSASRMPLTDFVSLISRLNDTLGGGVPVWKSLSFVVQHQQQNEWCWAAVTASLSLYYDASSPWTQGSIVNDQFGQTTCTFNGSAPACNRPWYLDVALTRTGNLAQTQPNYVSIDLLRGEVDGGRPIAVRVGWATGGGHFLTLLGYSDENWVEIQDPWFGQSTLDYDHFRTAYQGSGTWTHSFLTKG